MAHQEPACESLIDFVEAVAGGDLRDLEPAHQQVAVQHPAEHGHLAELFFKQMGWDA